MWNADSCELLALVRDEEFVLHPPTEAISGTIPFHVPANDESTYVFVLYSRT